MCKTHVIIRCVHKFYYKYYPKHTNQMMIKTNAGRMDLHRPAMPYENKTMYLYVLNVTLVVKETCKMMLIIMQIAGRYRKLLLRVLLMTM